VISSSKSGGAGGHGFVKEEEEQKQIKNHVLGLIKIGLEYKLNNKSSNSVLKWV